MGVECPQTRGIMQTGSYPVIAVVDVNAKVRLVKKTNAICKKRERI
jgi:hypothetical protein